MRMRNTIALFTLVGTIVGFYVYDTASDKACIYTGKREQIERCFVMKTAGGTAGYIAPFALGGALLGLFLVPLFHTRRDEEQDELREKQKKLKELKRERAIADLDVR